MMEIRDRHLIFCTKYCSQVNNYKHGNSANLKVISDKFNVNRTCTCIISCSQKGNDDDDDDDDCINL
jgi:hypothetical protein